MDYTDEQIRDMLKLLPLGIFNLEDLKEIFKQENEI